MMTPHKHSSANRLVFALMILVMVFSTGCGTKIIRGAAPMVRMSELSHQDQKIRLELSMRNLNGVELNIQHIDVSLSADDNELFSYQGPAKTNIIANGTEIWSVEVEESQSSRELLNSLEDGEVMSLPYTLKGTVLSADDGSLRFEYEGHIYPLPGRPGQFR